MEERDYNELQELREQVGLLKEKLQRQQIISERVIIEAAQKGISKLNRAGKVSLGFGIFAVVWCTWAFYTWGFSTLFVGCTAIFLAACVGATAYAHWGLMSIDISRGNLVEITQRLLRFRKIYTRWQTISMSLLMVWCYFLYHDAKSVMENPKLFLIAGSIGGVIGLIVGLKKYYMVLRDTDKVLANVNDLLQHRD